MYEQLGNKIVQQKIGQIKKNWKKQFVLIFPMPIGIGKNMK